MVKNLHIQNTDKFIEPYIKFINKHFNPSSHTFAVLTKNEKEKFGFFYSNVKYIYSCKNYAQLIINMYSCEKIIVHGLNKNIIIFLLTLQPWLLKKTYWVVWGGDLYSYRKRNTSYKLKLKEIFRKFIFKRMGHIVTLVREDYALVKEWYKTKAVYYHGAYINPLSKKFLDELETINKDSNSPTVIQIGNSADSSNNHIEVLKKLEKFKDDNILLTVPLSYGDKSHAERVIKVGKSIFGEKFRPLTEFIPPEKYSEYLNSIDIAIFNNDRQQALGNIYALLYLNKEVFVRKSTSMNTHFIEEFNIHLSNVESIDTMNITNIVNRSSEKYKEKISPVYNDDYLVKIWNSIFNGNLVNKV